MGPITPSIGAMTERMRMTASASDQTTMGFLTQFRIVCRASYLRLIINSHTFHTYLGTVKICAAVATVAMLLHAA